jgi:hypothetical protein
MIRRFAAALVCVALLVPAGAAHAATATAKDNYDGSIPALNVKSGTFRYGEQAAVIRVRFADLSRKKTMLVTKYMRRDGVTIVVATKFVNGSKRVLVHRSDEHSYDGIPARHVQATWNFRTDVIRIRIGEPLLAGRTAGFLTWSQHKGAQHGDSGNRDSLYVRKLQRG